MGERSDRLLVLLIAAGGMLVLLVGWEWALVEGVEVQLTGWQETGLYVLFGLVLAVVLVAIWLELRHIDSSRD